MRELSYLGYRTMTVKKLKNLYSNNRLVINKNYQRSYVWKKLQRQEFIQSILENNPIGVLVLWENRKNQLEVLDGQQRIETINRFYSGKIRTLRGRKFSRLGTDGKSKFEAYVVPYLELAQNLSPEQISTIFIRLQEGTTLSNGEKVYAFRGNFRNVFVKSFFDTQQVNLFSRLKDTRFRAKFLAAKLLFLEIAVKYSKNEFPYLSFKEFKKINNKYKQTPVPKEIVKRYNNNLQFLAKYLYGMLKALSFEDIVSSYLLLSHFNQSKVNEKHQGIKFKDFIIDLQHDLHKFRLYDTQKPGGMPQKLFLKLKLYKQLNKKGTTPDSLEGRFKIMKEEWEKRIGQIRLKDPQRLFKQEQKIELYFKQKGICPICNKEIVYGDVEADHIQEHETGGRTEVDNGRLLHHECHVKIHQEKQKANKK